MKKYILIILVFSLFFGNSFAQCNDKLVQIAIDSIGDDATYIQNFKVRLKKAKNIENIPVASFSIVLNAGTHYRFNVESASEFPGRVFLDLFHNASLVGTTHEDSRNKDYKKFDFLCRSTDNYKVVMYFKEGKLGCAVGILSIIIGEKREIEATDIGINGKSGGFITKQEIIDNPVLKLLSEKDSPKIKEFSLFIGHGNILKSNSDKFTEEQMKEIKRLKPSDKFTIGDVKIETDSDSYYLSKSLYFQIIEVQDNDNFILYTKNENIVEITSTLAGNENLDVSIDKGKMEGDKGRYSIWIENEGVVNMKIIAKDKKGEVVETDSIKFQVIEMKPISAKLFGKNGGILRKEEIQFNNEKLELEFLHSESYKSYDVLNFYVGEDRTLLKGIKSETGKLTMSQIKFIQNLNSGDVFYVKDIIVKTPLNNIIRLSDLGFIME